MEHPPLIDVEAEEDGKSKLSGCSGCFGKLFKLVIGLLVLSLLVMAAAYFVWGGDIAKEEEGAGAGAESVEEEKTGFAGVVDKVKRAVKGEPAPTAEEAEAATEGEKGPVSGEGGATGDGVANAIEKSTELAEAAGAEAKSPEERNKMLKEKFGHLEEDRPESAEGEGADLAEGAGRGGNKATNGEGEMTRDALGGGEGGNAELPEFGEDIESVPEKAARRGGSFGSSTGSATAGGGQNRYQIWRGDFSTSGSDLEFEVIFQEAGGQLQFRCFVMPYDAQTAKLFLADKGDFLLSFSDIAGQRLVPSDNELPIPLTKMTAFEANGQVAGWVARGMIPLEGQKIGDLKSVRLGWDFDKELGDWLKELKQTRSE